MSSYDEIIADELLQIHKQTKRIADSLEKLINKNIAREMIQGLKAEDQELQVDTIVYDGLEEREEITMDLKQVTPMLETEKALLVVKNGLQAWLMKSGVNNHKDEIVFGSIMDIDYKKWHTDQLKWEKYEVKKR